MKIAQFVHGYPPEFIGGTEAYTQALSRRLVERGHTCMVVAGSEWPFPELALSVSEDRGVLIARLVGLPRRGGSRPSVFDPMADTLIRRALDWWRPHLVHIHHWSRLTSNIAAVCAELEIPAVVTLHDQWVACSRYHRLRPDEGFCADRVPPCASCVDRDAWQPAEEIDRELEFRGRAIERELRLADRILVPSVAQQAFIGAISGVPRDRMEVVPLGSPRSEVEWLDRPEPRAVGGPVRIGFWGYLLPEKGVHLLLEAARDLAGSAAAEWHLFGTAPSHTYRARLARIAEGLDVRFHGAYALRDLRSANLDLAVFPSLCCETYSFVLDEAFQLGLPVIVPNRGAFPERLGSAGLLFACGERADLVAKIGSVLASPAALDRLKQEVRSGKMTAMNDHIRHVEKIYQEVVDSYVAGPPPDHEYRELLLHQHQQLADRDREIERLLGEGDREIERLLGEGDPELERLLAGRKREFERLLAERDKEIGQLKDSAAELRRGLDATLDRLRDTEADAARLGAMVARLEEERRWWRQQTRALEGDFERLRRSPLHQIYLLLRNGLR